jgi:redox-sensitive bicupin YhaK (pirin superfamily)
MDPLVMVDHYRMTESTFGAHPHAGLSAVSVLFEDSEGAFHNRDSLGNDFDMLPGDLYWLKAGSGAVHDESPRTGASIHGLQVFVNLPARMKHDAPESRHVKAQDIPVLETDGYRVRVVLGNSNGISGRGSPALPMTILDGRIGPGSAFTTTCRPVRTPGSTPSRARSNSLLPVRKQDCKPANPSLSKPPPVTPPMRSS